MDTPLSRRWRASRLRRTGATRVLVVALAAASLMSAVLGTASTAGATLGAPLSSAFLDSEASDPVGGGQRLVLSTVTDNSGTSPGTTGSTSWALSGSGHTATLNLASPLGDPLTVGTYENAQGAPRTAGHPLLSVTIDSNSCSSFSGRFIVDEITTNGSGTLLTFSARFEQHCNGGDPALFGAVSYNATADFRGLTITPSTIDFGARQNNGTPSSPRTITITNDGPSNLSITQMTYTGITDAGFAWSPGTCGQGGVTLAVGESCTVDVNFTGMGAAGPRSGKFTFFDDLSPQGGTGRDVELKGAVVNVGATPWQSLGGVVNADPAAASDPSGVYVVVRGGDGGYYLRRYANGTWSSYQPLGGSFSSLPWIVSDAAGSSGVAGIHVFGRGLDNALYTGHITNGVFSGWQSLGGYLTSYPSAVVGTTGIDVGVRGGDGALYTRHLAGGVWAPYQSLGGFINSGPWLVSHPSGTYAFVTGGDLVPYWRSITAGNWQALGGFASSPPIAVRDAVGISYYVRGLDGSVYARQWNGSSWSIYFNLGGFITSVPTAVVDTAGTSVFARGGDGALYSRRFENGTWKPWLYYGGNLLSDAIVTSVDSVDHVFVVGTDGGLYTRQITFAPTAQAATADTADGPKDVPPPGSAPSLGDGARTLLGRGD